MYLSLISASNSSEAGSHDPDFPLLFEETSQSLPIKISPPIFIFLVVLTTTKATRQIYLAFLGEDQENF